MYLEEERSIFYKILKVTPDDIPFSGHAVWIPGYKSASVKALRKTALSKQINNKPVSHTGQLWNLWQPRENENPGPLFKHMV